MKRLRLFLIFMVICFNLYSQDKTKKQTLQDLSVTFFHPSKMEFDSIAKLRNSEGLYEASSDFGFYASEIINEYKDSAINVSISNGRYFRFNEFTIDKLAQKSIFGIILVNNQKIKIETGIFTDADINQIVQDFFHEISDNEIFENFQKQFYSDSIFQKNRILTPLAGEILEWDEQQDTVVKSDWSNKKIGQLKNFEFLKNELPNLRFSTEIIGDIISEKIYIENSGFYITRKFSLKNGKWYLIESTISNL